MKIKILMTDLYTSKKTGRQSWRVTGISSDGPVRFFVPLEDNPKPEDIYTIKYEYNSFDFSYRVVYVKAQQ